VSGRESSFLPHFGGPDAPPRALRDLLAARVAAVPVGGAIDWITYYFRDRALAQALVAAHARGVRVRITLEGRPRTPHANDAVRAILAPALGRDLRISSSPLDRFGWGKRWRPRLHEKLYCFSHPAPVALVGSFNPSGDEPEDDPAIVAEIGDQDRGHNVLVELREAPLALALAAHARRVHATPHTKLERFLPSRNAPLRGHDCTVWLRPRAARDPVLGIVAAAGRGTRLRLTASHLSGRSAPAALAAAAARGAEIDVIAEATERRVPGTVALALSEAGVRIRKLRMPGVPMHLKLLLAEGPDATAVAFGSFNWTENSIRHNRELVVVAWDPALFSSFAARFERLAASLPA